MAVNGVKDRQTANTGFDLRFDTETCGSVAVVCGNISTTSNDQTEISSEAEIILTSENRGQPSSQNSDIYGTLGLDKGATDTAYEECEQLIPTRLENPSKSAAERANDIKNSQRLRNFKSFVTEKDFEMSLHDENRGSSFGSVSGNSEKPFVMPSIKDRIAALRCASHMAELDLTPVRDTAASQCPTETSGKDENCKTEYTDYKSSVGEQGKPLQEPEVLSSYVEKGQPVKDVLKSLDSAQSTIENILCQLNTDRDSDPVNNNPDGKPVIEWKALDKQSEVENDNSNPDVLVENSEIIAPAEVQSNITTVTTAQRDVEPSEAVKTAKVSRSPFGLKRRSSNPVFAGNKSHNIQTAKRPQTFGFESYSEDQKSTYETVLLSQQKTESCEQNLGDSEYEVTLHYGRIESKVKRPNNSREHENNQAVDTSFNYASSPNLVKPKLDPSEVNDIGEDENSKLEKIDAKNVTHMISQEHVGDRSSTDNVVFEISFDNAPTKHRLKPKLSSDARKRSTECVRNLNSDEDLNTLEQSGDGNFSPIVENEQFKQNNKQTENVSFEVSFSSQMPKCRLKPKLSSDAAKPFVQSTADSKYSEQQQKYHSSINNVAFEIYNVSTKHDLKCRDAGKRRIECARPLGSDEDLTAFEQSGGENVSPIVENEQSKQSSKQTENVAFEVSSGSQRPKDRLKPKLSNGAGKRSIECARQLHSDEDLATFEQSGGETVSPTVESEQLKENSKQTENVAFEVSFGSQRPKGRLKPKLSSDLGKRNIGCARQLDSGEDLATFKQSGGENVSRIVVNEQSKQSSKQTENIAYEVSFGGQSPKGLLNPKLSNDVGKQNIECSRQLDSGKDLATFKQSGGENVSHIVESEQVKESSKQTENVAFEVSFGGQSPKGRLKPKLNSDFEKPFVQSTANSKDENQNTKQQSFTQETNIEENCLLSAKECQPESKGISFDIDIGDHPPKRKLKPTLSSTLKNEKETNDTQIFDYPTNDSSKVNTKQDGFSEHDSSAKLKRGTYDLDSVSDVIKLTSQYGLPVIDTLNSEHDSSSKPKRGTYDLDSVSDSLKMASQQDLPVTDMLHSEHDRSSKPKHGTYDLDSVSDSLKMASQRGLPVIDALNDIVRTIERVQENTSSHVKGAGTSRGTYSLDSVADSLQVSNDKGISVTDSLKNLAEMEEKKSSPIDVRLRKKLPQSGKSSISGSEVEGDENISLLESESCGQNRGTYNLDSVSDSLEDGHRKGLSDTEVLSDLAGRKERTNSTSSVAVSISTSIPFTPSKLLLAVPTQKSEISTPTKSNRATYTLNDVEHSLQTATEKGIPFVEALEKIASVEPKENILSCVGNRGTFTLDEVSESVEEAKRKGLPVVEVLKNLSQAEQPKKEASLEEPGNRSTYTLDEVAQTLEKAKEKGLPVVAALDFVSNDSESVSLHDNAKFRRLEKLKNRKTYALASPLETVSEGQKLRLFDGTERLSLPLCSPPPIPKPPRPSLARRLSAQGKSLSDQSLEKKGLPVLQKLDLLTSACEVLLQSSSKSAGKSRVSVSSTSHDKVPGPNYRSVSKERARRRVLRNIAADLERKSELPEALDLTNRSTYSLDEAAKSLEDAQVAGMPIIDALDQLSSKPTVDRLGLGEAHNTSFAEEQRTDEGTTVFKAISKQHSMDNTQNKSSFHNTPLMSRSYSLDDVAFAFETSRDGIPFTRILNESTLEQQPQQDYDLQLEQNQSQLSVLPTSESSKRGTYSLDEVSKTLDEASKELPIIEALEGIAVDASKEIRKSFSLLDDLEMVTTSDPQKMSESESGNRGTATLDSVGTTLDSAKARGLPVIEALGELIKAVDTIRRQSRHSMEIIDVPNQSSEDQRVGIPTKDRVIDNEAGIAVSTETLSSNHSFNDSQVKRGTYPLGDVSSTLDHAQETGLSVESALKDISSKSYGHRGTYDLDEVGVSLDTAKDKGLPVISALDKILQAVEGEKEMMNKFSEACIANDVKSSDYSSVGGDENQNVLNTKPAPAEQREKPKHKPRTSKRLPFKKPKVSVDPDSFYIELFPGGKPKSSGTEAKESLLQEVQLTIRSKSEKEDSVTNNMSQSSKTDGPMSSMQRDPVERSSLKVRRFSSEQNKSHPEVMPLKQVDESSCSSPEIREQSLLSPRTRATWRPSATVLDKISSMLDTAEDFGLSVTDVLDHVADVSEKKGEIIEGDVEEENKATSSQLALLHMQLEEKRRHIEAEKLRNQAQQEEEWRRVRQTAFWYVLGKARGEPGFEKQSKAPQPEEESGRSSEVLVGGLNRGGEISEQPTPPIEHSSPKTPPRDDVPGYETREYRLSEFPPQGHTLKTNQRAFSVGAEIPGNIRPKRERTPSPSTNQVSSGEPNTPQRRCWTINSTTPPTLPHFGPPAIEEMDPGKCLVPEPSNSAVSGSEIEVEEESAKKGGLALFIGDDANTSSQGLTPEQQKKRERFMQSRLKKQEEERAKKEAELEKKRRREEKQREKEMQKKQEEQRRRWEEKERHKLERERLDRAHAERLTQEGNLAAGYTTYRTRPGARSRPQPDREETEPTPHYPEDIAYAKPQAGFAEFSGPQCYVQPSGKSNKKLMINAVSYVCLCGAPNKEAKEKCLQAINECPIQNFMALFRDGLKFRGLYSYVPGADQISKIYGIGPRVITVKMIENVYKYNSGSKEFVKIPSTKTLSIQVDGISIQKSCWQTNKPAVQSKTMSNLRRPPPRTQR